MAQDFLKSWRSLIWVGRWRGKLHDHEGERDRHGHTVTDCLFYQHDRASERAVHHASTASIQVRAKQPSVTENWSGW